MTENKKKKQRRGSPRNAEIVEGQGGEVNAEHKRRRRYIVFIPAFAGQGLALSPRPLTQGKEALDTV